MELDAKILYKMALDQCMVLQQQVIELKALYLQASEEIERLKSDNDK